MVHMFSITKFQIEVHSKISNDAIPISTEQHDNMFRTKQNFLNTIILFTLNVYAVTNRPSAQSSNPLASGAQFPSAIRLRIKHINFRVSSSNCVWLPNSCVVLLCTCYQANPQIIKSRNM